MERVIKFVNEQFKHAGNSREVQNQKEELIASLHDKIHDAVTAGKSEEEAFAEATASLSGLEELAGMLDGSRRTVYVNRLNLHHAWLMYAVVSIEFLLCRAVFVAVTAANAGLDAILPLFGGQGILMLAVLIWPVISTIIYRKNPAKAELMEFNFNKLFTGALIGWLAVSLGLAIVNIATLPVMDEKVIWFFWPMIGVSNWPMSLVVYNKLFKSRRYLAEY